SQLSNRISSILPSETKVLKVGEIPVDMVKISSISIFSGNMGKGNGMNPKQPDMQNAFFLAPKGEGKWEQKADMPTARDSFSTSVVDGKIYAIGGWLPGNTSISTVEEYDPVKDVWTKKADMLTARDNLSTCVVDGKIYAIGGTNWANMNFTSAVEMYDPATDKWMKREDMPTPRYSLSASVVNGKIYAIGGAASFGGPALSTVEEYDPIKDKWTKKENMPTQRWSLSTIMVNGEIYAIGGQSEINGRGDAPSLSTVEVYNPMTDKWKKKADMPTARAFLSTCEVNSEIYAIGGGLSFMSAFPTVEVYNPAEDKWTNKDDMPTARKALSSSAVNGKIYAIGGSTAGNAILGTVEKYDIASLVVEARGKLSKTWGNLKSR
ncbi:MAG: kelch repeat-containing protein, partial [Candidatus Poribacteria bacterium]